MAVNNHTLANARRTLYVEAKDAPRVVGAGGLNLGVGGSIPVLLPWSRLVVDGTEYIETNSTTTTSDIPNEGGGTHACPSHGTVVRTEFGSRSLGVRSAYVKSGVTGQVSPEDIQLHKFGWI